MAHRLHHRPTSDLSLHHLPSPSRPDDSLSFEIPLAVSSADLLLADNSDDFLKGVDCTLTTPPPSRALDTPLTLSELSPTPRVATIPSFQIPSTSSSRLNTNLPDRPSPQKTPQLAGSTRLNTPKLVNTPVSAARLASLKAEIDSLGRDSGEETETEPSKPAIQRAPTAKLPATRLRHDTKLRKGDERKQQTKAVRMKSPILLIADLLRFVRRLSTVESPREASGIYCHRRNFLETFLWPRGNTNPLVTS